MPRRPRRHVRPVAVVAPHAGFRFSGPVAATAYAHLASWRGEVASVVVLGPAHFTPLRGMAIPSVEAFDTPLGPIPVDADARARRGRAVRRRGRRRAARGRTRHRDAVTVPDPHAGPRGPGSPRRRRRHAAVCRRHSPVHPARRTRHDRRRLHRPEPLPEPCTGARTRHRTPQPPSLARNGDALHPATPAASTPCAGCCATPWTATSSSSSSSWPRRPTPEAIPGASSDTEPSCSMRELANPLSGSRTRPRRLISGHRPRTRTDYQAFEDRPPPDPAVYRACWVVQVPVGMRGHAEDVHVAVADLEYEQDVEPAQRHRTVDVEKVDGQHAGGLRAQELASWVSVLRDGAGGIRWWPAGPVRVGPVLAYELAPTSELTLLGEHSAPPSSSPRSGVGRPANTRRHEYIRATGEPDHSWCA